MRRLRSAIVCVVLSAAPAAAQVATFDDLPNCVTFDRLMTIHAPNFTVVPNGYLGFGWSGFSVVDRYDPDIDGLLRPEDAIGTVSTPCMAINSRGAPAEITSATPFTYNGGYFTASFQNGQPLQITGFFGLTPLFTQTLALSTAAPQMLDVNWAGVNRVLFEPATGAFDGGVRFDNLRFNNAPDVTGTPEPSTWALIATGLCFLAGVARWRRKAAV